MTSLELHEAETTSILRRLRASGRTLKKKKRPPVTSAATAKALREGGLSEKDITTLIEGAEHERNFLAGVEGAVRFRADLPPRVSAALDVLQEQVSSGVGPDTAMIPPTQYGWTGADPPGTFTHREHGTLHTSAGKWTRRDKAGVIRGSGTTQESLTAHLKAVNGGGSPAASEGLEDILTRIRNDGSRDTVPPEARVMAEERLRPRGPDLTAAHAVAAERLQGRSHRIPAEAVRLVEEIRAREAGRMATSPSG